MIPLKTDPQSGILYRQWQAGSPRAVFLLIHGMGGHSARWEFFTEYFLRQDFSSYAIELKGFGETRDIKGHVSSFNVYYNDLRALSAIINKENPGKKIFLVGESMGGLIAFVFALKEPHLLNGVVCMVPAFGSAMKIPWYYYFQLVASLFYNRRKQFKMPFNAAMCTKDTQYQKVMDANPAEHRFATTSLLISIIIEQIRAMTLKNKLKIPVLFMAAGKDYLVDEKLVRKVFYSMKVKDKEIVEYPELLHALPIELERQKVFDDVLTWVNKKI
jgi:alpha-beta hydrolase superfamily lysophospholipase